MADRTDRERIVRGYASALLTVAEAEGTLPVVEEELYVFAKTLEANNELREALTDISLPAERKRAVVGEILGARASPHTANILGFLVEQGRARELGRIIEELAQMAAEQRRHVVAEVRSAVPLDERRRVSLESALSTATGRAVEVKVVVDPSVVGGLVARVGDEVIDGTVRARLRKAQGLLRS